jgi:hypothetical protein
MKDSENCLRKTGIFIKTAFGVILAVLIFPLVIISIYWLSQTKCNSNKHDVIKGMISEIESETKQKPFSSSEKIIVNEDEQTRYAETHYSYSDVDSATVLKIESIITLTMDCSPVDGIYPHAKYWNSTSLMIMVKDNYYHSIIDKENFYLDIDIEDHR